MIQRKFIPAIVAAVIALGAAAGVVAETGKNRQSPPEVKTALLAKSSLVDAVATVEQRTGGRVLKIEAEHENGTPLYEMKVLTNGNITKVFVGIGNGKVIRTEKLGLIERTLEREDVAELAKYAAMPTTLSAAIKTAAQYAGGKAIKAEVESENGKLLVEVKVSKGQSVQAVKVDGTTGKIVKATEEKEHEKDGKHEDD